jgi:hypothetical protein
MVDDPDEIMFFPNPAPPDFDFAGVIIISIVERNFRLQPRTVRGQKPEKLQHSNMKA